MSMEYFIAIFSLIFFLIISSVVYKNNFSQSFFLVSILSSLTILGDINVNLVLIFLSMIILLINRSMVLKKNDLIFISVFFVCMFFICLLPSFEGITIIHALGKWIKVLCVFFPMLFINKLKDGINPRTFSISFCISSLIFGVFYAVFIGLKVGIYNIPRFNGFFTDANYFSLVCVVFYIINDSYCKINRSNLSQVFLLILILMAQSFSVISFLFLYYIKVFLFGKEDKKYYINQYLPLILCMLYYLFVFNYYYYGDVSLRADYMDNMVSYKLNSVLMRVKAQFGAIEMILNHNILYLTGYGSGTSVALFGRVTHNAYLQMLFDNGIIFVVIVLTTLGNILKKIEAPIYIVFLLLITNYLFDNIFMFLFTFFIAYYLCVKNTKYKY